MTDQEHKSRSRRYLLTLLVVSTFVALFAITNAFNSSADRAEQAAGTPIAADSSTSTIPLSDVDLGAVGALTGQGTDQPATTTSTSEAPTTTAQETTTTMEPQGRSVTKATSTTTTSTTTTTTLPATTTTTTTLPPTTTTTTTLPPTTTTTTVALPEDVVFTLVDHSGVPISGGTIAVLDAASWRDLGVSDSTGSYTGTFAPGSYTVRMSINGSAEMRDITVGGIATALGASETAFKTGRLTLVFTGDIRYGADSPDTIFPGTAEFLTGVQTFSFSDATHAARTTTISVASGDDILKTVIYARLTDSTGSPVSQGAVTGWLPPGRSWQTMGTTDASGAALYLYVGLLDDDVAAGSTTIRMEAPGGGFSTKAHNPVANSFYDFATSIGTVSLVDYLGAPLADGTASIYTNGGWNTVGMTDGSGTVTFEAFPGSYSIAMSYSGTREQRDGVNAHIAPVAFQTGRFAVVFTGDLSWGPGSLYPYAGPQQVLPGDYYVNFSRLDYPGVNKTLRVDAGDDLTKTGVYVRVRSSAGTGVEGTSTVINLSGWPSLGTTDSRGVTVGLLDGLVAGTRTVRATYNGTTTQVAQDLGSDSFYDFSTLEATIRVEDSLGNPISGLAVKQNSSGWPTIGTTDPQGEVRIELFEGSTRSYSVTYNGTTATLKKTFTTAARTLTFSTLEATIRVEDSLGNPISGLAVKQNSSGWPTIGTTDPQGEVRIELFEGSTRSYSVTYNGTTATLKKTFTTTDTLLVFVFS